MAGIDIVFWGDGVPPVWELGQVYRIAPTPRSLHEWIKTHLSSTTAHAWLFWDGSAGQPDARRIEAALQQPGHVWHAGLKFGTNHVTFGLDFVEPTWMLNAYPDESLTVTTWRLSLRAALIPVDVFRHLGNFNPQFETLDGAALEFGYRCARRGAIIRHLPEMIKPDHNLQPSKTLPIADEFRLLRSHFTRRWVLWALLRMLLTGFASPLVVIRAWWDTRSMPPVRLSQSYPASPPTPDPADAQAQVSVLIPTIDRYPYLYVLLEQLQQQTIPPYEIIIVDQTEAEIRDPYIAENFPQLPLKIFYMDIAGQCRSRNLGLRHVTGEYVLFLDDDDEIPADLIERHLFVLRHYRADVSSGVVYEPGQTPSEVESDVVRLSSVFPTNNTMIRRGVLHHTGGFDMAYDRRARADGDLGMRVYLSGQIMLIDERRAILHHHAARGGLRTHKARVVTRSSSRKSLFKRHLLVASEIYLAQRYFTQQQVREYIIIRLFATLSGMTGVGRMAKILVGLIQLPFTLWHFRHQRQIAARMSTEFPQIPPVS